MYACRMITDAARSELAKDINSKTTEQLWSRAEQLIRSNLYLSTENHFIGGNGAWSVTRKHKKFIEEVLDNLVAPANGHAAIVGGMPGAGKSKMLPAFFNPGEYYVIDPDDIKEWLVNNGLHVPIDGLTPLETGPLLHVESTVLAKKLSEILIAKRVNIIWPLTFSNADAVSNRLSMAQKASYERIDGAYVKVSVGTSTDRVKARYAEGMQQFCNGVGLGGRFIDLEAINRNPSPALFNKFTSIFTHARMLDNDMDLL